MEKVTAETVGPVELGQRLRNWALDHVERHPDLVLMKSPVPVTELTLSAQYPSAKHIAGSPLGPSDIEDFVTTAEPRFPGMIDTLEEHEKESGLITAIGENLESGQNVIVVSNHDKITNLGYVLAAYIYQLKSKGYSFRAGTIVGKITPYLGRDVGGRTMSLTDVLALGCDDVYMGYPDTESTAAAGIPSDTADKHNGGMLKVLLTNMRRGGNLLIIDPTGTTNKPAPSGEVEFGEISQATERILQKPGNLLLPTGIWLENGQNVFATNGTLYRLNGNGDGTQNITMPGLMNELALLLNKNLDPAVARFKTAGRLALDASFNGNQQ